MANYFESGFTMLQELAKKKLALSKLLADSYTLYLVTHNFHWNVTDY